MASLRAGSALARAVGTSSAGMAARQFHASTPLLAGSGASLMRAGGASSVGMAARQFHASPMRQKVHVVESREDLTNALKQHKVVVLDCMAHWCMPCRMMGPIYKNISNEPINQHMHFMKFDIEDLPDLAAELEITAMPTWVFFQDGKRVDHYIGGNPGMLDQYVEKWRPPWVGKPPKDPPMYG